MASGLRIPKKVVGEIGDNKKFRNDTSIVTIIRRLALLPHDSSFSVILFFRSEGSSDE